MAGSCEGRVALVTGASRGLGKSISAEAGGRRGDRCHHGTDDGPRPHVPRFPDGDLSRDRRIRWDRGRGTGRFVAAHRREGMFAEVLNRVGPPEILVNNAAVTFLRPLDEFPERRALLMVEMHLMAPLHLTQLALPAMRGRGEGWVLNLTSVAGDHPSGPPFSEFDRGGASACTGRSRRVSTASR